MDSVFPQFMRRKDAGRYLKERFEFSSERANRKHAPPGEPISYAQMFISSRSSGPTGRLVGVTRADTRREEAPSNQSAHGHSEGGQK
jgi:hypothetical protein